MVVEQRSHYNISQAAEVLGVSRVTIWRWIRDGRIPAARLGHRTTRISREDLERVLQPIWSATPSVASALPARNGASEHDAESSAPRAHCAEMGVGEHFVQFYESDTVLIDALEEYIGAALRAGEAGVVVATPEHREALDARLQAAGLDIAAARAAGRYLSLDATETLARFMRDGRPDPGRFAEVAADILGHACADRRQARVFGEMVALLAADGNHAAALGLEELWNDAQQRHDFALFCAYPIDRFAGDAFAEALSSVCAAHSRVIPAESYSALPTADERLRAITTLQQKATWLEAEIAERERIEERLRVALEAEQVARAEAEAALRVRDEFLSIAAHELRTPLTGLSGYAQLVLRQMRRDQRLDPERVVKALEMITSQGQKLSSLLNQLLDVSRLEAGKLWLDRRPTDLAALVAQVVTGARATNARQPITLTAPATLRARVDPLRLEQVLTNLLDNAIKHGPAGAAIDVRVSQSQGEPAAIELSVRDRGPGIPPEKRERIFERFYQAHDTGPAGGMGLGLYISRQIVDLHGGDIRAEFPTEDTDGGTRFVVRLPLGPDEPATAHSTP